MSNQKIHEAGTQEFEVNAAEEDRSQHETDSSTTRHALAQHPAAQTRLVSAGQWMREVTGFNAPFGHDGLPTVWG
jgi:hypothetical protein